MKNNEAFNLADLPTEKEGATDHESKQERLNQNINSKVDYLINIRSIIFETRYSTHEVFAERMENAFSAFMENLDPEILQKISLYLDYIHQSNQGEGSDDENDPERVDFEILKKDPDVLFLNHISQVEMNLSSKRKEVERYEGLDESERKSSAISKIRYLLQESSQISEDWLTNKVKIDMSQVDVKCNGISLDIYVSKENWMKMVRYIGSEITSDGQHYPGTPFNVIVLYDDSEKNERTRTHEEMHNIFESLSLDNIYGSQARDLIRDRTNELASIIKQDPESESAQRARQELKNYILSFSKSLTNELFADIEEYRQTGNTPAYDSYVREQAMLYVGPYLRQGFPKDLGLDGRAICEEYQKKNQETAHMLKEIYDLAAEHDLVDKAQAAVILFPDEIRKAKRFVDWLVSKKA